MGDTYGAHGAGQGSVLISLVSQLRREQQMLESVGRRIKTQLSHVQMEESALQKIIANAELEDKDMRRVGGNKRHLQGMRDDDDDDDEDEDEDAEDADEEGMLAKRRRQSLESAGTDDGRTAMELLHDVEEDDGRSHDGRPANGDDAKQVHYDSSKLPPSNPAYAEDDDEDDDEEDEDADKDGSKVGIKNETAEELMQRLVQAKAALQAADDDDDDDDD